MSPALRKVIGALKVHVGGADRVFDERTPNACTAARASLIAEYGAPTLTWKGLRSTCSTYLTNASGIYGAASAFLAARQSTQPWLLDRQLPADRHRRFAPCRIRWSERPAKPQNAK